MVRGATALLCSSGYARFFDLRADFSSSCFLLLYLSPSQSRWNPSLRPPGDIPGDELRIPASIRAFNV